MNPSPELTVQPTYMVDSRANLIIEADPVKLTLSPGDALEMLKFLERTGYQAHAANLNKGVAP